MITEGIIPEIASDLLCDIRGVTYQWLLEMMLARVKNLDERLVSHWCCLLEFKSKISSQLERFKRTSQL